MTLRPPAAPADAAEGAASAAAPARALPDRTTTALRALVLASLLALAALCVAWELWLAPTGGRTLVVKALPLLLALPGVLRHRLYTFRWLALLVWLYVMEGAVRLDARGGWLAAAEIALALLLFGGCGAYIRWRLHRGRRMAEETAARKTPER